MTGTARTLQDLVAGLWVRLVLILISGFQSSLPWISEGSLDPPLRRVLVSVLPVDFSFCQSSSLRAVKMGEDVSANCCGSAYG